MGMREIGVLFFLAFSFSVWKSHGLEGKTSATSIEEDLELERQLKILNKPFVKNIKTEYGDLFDCVDINKQPAFDHPLLKNHKIELSPKSYKIDIMKKASSRNEGIKNGLKDGGCPRGTVPIRRTTKEELIRARSLSNNFRNRNIVNVRPQAADRSEFHYATHQFLPNNGKYQGAVTFINAWNPKVNNDQYSNVQIWVQSGPLDQLNVIEVGWTVNPTLFGDSQTRLFTYWTADGYQKTGCFNNLCPGYVQVHPNIAPGRVLPSISSVDGPQAEMKVKLERDSKNGRWQLILTESNVLVGYWPNSLFTSLADGASEVHFGGQVRSPSPDNLPPMGSGNAPSDGYKKACYIRKIQLSNGTSYIDPDHYPQSDYTDCDFPYFVGETDLGDDFWGYNFYVGGPGGKCKG